MTDLTLEMLRAELAGVRQETAVVPLTLAAIETLRADIRALRIDMDILSIGDLRRRIEALERRMGPPRLGEVP
jgi:hypothetical protein